MIKGLITITVPIHKVHQSKISVEKLINLKPESSLTKTKLLTNSKPGRATCLCTNDLY